MPACGPLGGGSGGGNHQVVNAPGLRDLGSRLREAGNAYRRSSGKSTLARHAGLEEMARQHAEAMARSGNLSHGGGGNRNDLARSRYGMIMTAENVMRWHTKVGGGVPAMLRVWTESSGHRRNLLGEWAVTGIGLAQDELGNIWVMQIFGTEPRSR